MELSYDEKADGAHVTVRSSIRTEDTEDLECLDADRIVRFGADGHALMYSFLNVRRFGVRLDDLEHREGLGAPFRDAGFSERDWGHPIPTKVIHRRDRAAG